MIVRVMLKHSGPVDDMCTEYQYWCHSIYHHYYSHTMIVPRRSTVLSLSQADIYFNKSESPRYKVPYHGTDQYRTGNSKSALLDPNLAVEIRIPQKVFRDNTLNI